MLINTRFNDLEGNSYDGVRLGFQYLGDEKYGGAASYRSSIDLKLDGPAEGKAELAANGNDYTMTGGEHVSSGHSISSAAQFRSVL